MSKTAVSLVISLFCASVWAKGAKSPTAEVDQVLTKYRQAKGLEAKVKKTVTQELMGSTNTSTGAFYFSRGKLRLDITAPERSLLVYDGKTIWLESRLDEKTVQVTKMRSKELKKSDSLLAALFERKDVLRGFKLLSSKVVEGAKVYVFAPKDKKKTEVQHLELALKNKDLERVSYKDQVENTVSFEFEDLKRGPVEASRFSYKPPAGASITEM